MHEIEPYYNWRDYYIAAEDEQSPFYGTIYSEFDFDKQIYNFLLHPQWDEFGSLTLYLKILFVDYEKQYCIIELIGEWNDAIYNDIMLLKREIIDVLISQGIKYFILIEEFQQQNIDYYINFGGALNELPWRALKPKQVFHHVNDSLTKRLGF
jgi:hypothetical protein